MVAKCWPRCQVSRVCPEMWGATTDMYPRSLAPGVRILACISGRVRTSGMASADSTGWGGAQIDASGAGDNDSQAPAELGRHQGKAPGRAAL